MLFIHFSPLPGNQIYETPWNKYELFYIAVFPSSIMDPAFSVSTGRGVGLFMWARALLKTRLQTSSGYSKEIFILFKINGATLAL